MPVTYICPRFEILGNGGLERHRTLSSLAFAVTGISAHSSPPTKAYRRSATAGRDEHFCEERAFCRHLIPVSLRIWSCSLARRCGLWHVCHGSVNFRLLLTPAWSRCRRRNLQ